MNPQSPNFFIIGAPKSGTTALSVYLQQHPNVYFANPKEPHYFNDDFSHRHTQSFNQYQCCFANASREHAAIGEGSVFYLSSRTAVANILAVQPEARFVVMLRNPVEAVHAWHWQAIYSFGESFYDFYSAWQAQACRRNGQKIPRHNRVREALQYGVLFQYGDQLERLFSQVGRENVHIILFEDFKREPAATYQRLLRFLGLPPLELERYEVVNANKRFRSPFVEQLVRAGSLAKRGLGINKGWGIMTGVQQWNTRYESRPALDDTVRTELKNYYRADIEKASHMIDRDLTGWCGAND